MRAALSLKLVSAICSAAMPFSPPPWIWRQPQMKDSWDFPSSLAISRSWRDVDAFCNHLLSSPGGSSKGHPLFIDIGIKKSIKDKLNLYSTPPFEYIIFGTLDAIMLVLHGYPKKLTEMANFKRLLKHGLVSKLYWFGPGMECKNSPYTIMVGKELGKTWCNLELFFKMLDIKSVEKKPLPDSLLSLITLDNVTMWKRNSPQYLSRTLLPSASMVSPVELQTSLCELFSKISLFRSIIRDAQPNLLWMSEEDECEFSNYYSSDIGKLG
ncbi:hypothetical protein MDAP_000392 [Mitosporidium daphniae]|uniref:Uncharacterized protein n=1 Tax=Mitosporidium daphniae TaxID=1485682 RepID=A0A098VRA7_9MICR|nr:uncharacterized protein DI09_38p40 [Mitosporidium daphniae]KGG51334.1 hypothetical protein DI09_38p40 [Mitosporidium daphniae]|eukprot:XP_013237789.1 uncharacterized protein DI09_38p40 [Mitosporidium daphniae]